MANQDYISRTPPNKNKNSRRGKKVAKKPQGLPLKTKLYSIILLILIAAFGYGLWSLKTDPSTKTPVNPSVQKEIKETVQVKEKALPEKPEEKWTYHKELENQVIEPGKYEVKEKGPYKMQCGSFKTQKQAETLKAQIAFAGLEAQVKSVTGKNGTWHKVFLGPYPRKRLAEKDKHKLKRNNINYCQIWLWQ